VDSPKLIILPKILAYKRTAGEYPLGDFYQIFTVSGQHHDRSFVKHFVKFAQRVSEL